MKCPACHNEMTLLESGGTTVDACVGHCGGVWFDNRELQRVDEQAEAAGEAFLHVARDPALRVDTSHKRHCPVCPNITMMRHFFSVKRQIEVDECAGCGGMWLDADELERIRGEYHDTEAREQAAEELFHVHFDQQLATMRAESHDKAQRADRFAAAFKWMLPSTYLRP